MARYKMSGIGVVALQGRIGNQVFTRNGEGPYVKEVITNEPRGALVTDWKENVFAPIAEQWNLMSEDQRKAWNLLAQKSPVPFYNTKGNISRGKKLGGYQLFLKCNLSANRAFGSPFADVVSLDCPKVIVTDLSFTFSGSTFYVTYDSIGSYGVNDVVAIFASYPLNAGRMSPNVSYQWVTALAPFPGSTEVANPIHSAEFQFPASGQAVFLRIDIRNQATGMRTPYTFAKLIV